MGSKSVGTGLFVHGAYVNHSCNPNSNFHVECVPGRRPSLTIRTTRRLLKGEHVFISYVSLYSTVEQRKNTLYDTYRFECQCERCEAAYKENGLGSLIDAAMVGMVCTEMHCGQGLLEEVVVDEEDEEDEVEDEEVSGASQWECQECGAPHEMTQHFQSQQKLSQAISELRVVVSLNECDVTAATTTTGQQLKNLKGAMAEASKYLHPYHLLCHAARIMLVGMVWLNTNGKDFFQISKSAASAIEPLRNAQTLNEYNLWISILQTMCATNSKERDDAIHTLQYYYGDSIGMSFIMQHEVQRSVKKRRKHK